MEERPPPSKNNNKDKPSLSSNDATASTLKAKTKPSSSAPLLDLNATSSSVDLPSKQYNNLPDKQHTQKSKTTTTQSSTKEALQDFPEIRAYYEE
jgi:hypothetical protein